MSVADAYIQDGKLNEAIQVLQKAAERNSKNAVLRLRLGMLFEQKGDWKDAQTANEQALQLDNSDPVAQNNLAPKSCWPRTAEHFFFIDVALKIGTTRPKRRQPTSVNVSDTIGWIYYKKSSYDAALAYLKDCTEKSPKNPTFQYHLGMAYLQLGQKEQARAALQRSIQLDSHFRDADSARQALSQL